MERGLNIIPSITPSYSFTFLKIFHTIRPIIYNKINNGKFAGVLSHDTSFHFYNFLTMVILGSSFKLVLITFTSSNDTNQSLPSIDKVFLQAFIFSRKMAFFYIQSSPPTP